jgi:hypothetical protein
MQRGRAFVRQEVRERRRRARPLRSLSRRCDWADVFGRAWLSGITATGALRAARWQNPTDMLRIEASETLHAHRAILARRRVEVSAGSYRSGQTGQTVNLMAYAFAGSNPALPTLDI